MTDAGGDRSDMHRLPTTGPGLELDEPTAERLVAGRVLADDAPPAYVPVVRLLEAASGPARAAELADEDAVLAMYARERSQRDPDGTVAGSERDPVRVRPMRVAAIAIVGTLALTAPVAAAASTGRLPAPAQALVHDVLAQVGVFVPEPQGGDDPQDGPAPAPDSTPTTTVPADVDPGQGIGPTVCATVSDGTCQAGQGGPSGNPHAPSTPGATRPTPTTGPPVSPPSTRPSGPPVTRPDGPPSSPPSTVPANPTGPPASTPAGPPVAPPSTMPAGPPASTPGGPPVSTPGGRASPAGPAPVR